MSSLAGVVTNLLCFPFHDSFQIQEECCRRDSKTEWDCASYFGLRMFYLLGRLASDVKWLIRKLELSQGVWKMCVPILVDRISLCRLCKETCNFKRKLINSKKSQKQSEAQDSWNAGKFSEVMTVLKIQLRCNWLIRLFQIVQRELFEMNIYEIMIILKKLLKSPNLIKFCLRGCSEETFVIYQENF